MNIYVNLKNYFLLMHHHLLRTLKTDFCHINFFSSWRSSTKDCSYINRECLCNTQRNEYSKELFPKSTFYRNGYPTNIKIDDLMTQREGLHQIWPSSNILSMYIPLSSKHVWLLCTRIVYIKMKDSI